MAASGTRRLPNLVPERSNEHGVEDPAARNRSKQPLRCLLEGGVVRNGLEPDQRPEIGVVGQVHGQSPVIEA